MKTPMANSAGLLGCLLLMLGTLSGMSQRTDTLIPFTGHPWRFNDAGTDLGTAWRTNDFDDHEWSSGTGLFGFETNQFSSPPFPYLPTFSQITTPMLLNQSGIVTTTFYFRTWFTLDPTNLTPNTLIVSTNFIDDGAVMYINGIEVGRSRVASNQTFTTGASLLQNEGTNEVIFIDTNVLRIGSNLLAVELHQNAFPSTDIVWGHTLVGITTLPVEITRQPTNIALPHHETATFTVGASGNPITYRWQKESAPGSGVWITPSPAPPDLPAYSIVIFFTNSAGNYRVTLSNAVGEVISQVVKLTIHPDNVGPRVRSAWVTIANGLTNRILITFSESLIAPSSFTSNFTVSLLGTTNTVSNISASTVGGQVALYVNPANWHVEGTNQYIVTINNVQDTVGSASDRRTGNVIAPNTQVPVWWTNLVAGAETWPLPPDPDPVLELTPFGTNRYQLSWTGHGYALESTTNLVSPPGLPVFLAWPEVTNMSNPFLYIHNPAGPSRYFRLRK